MDHIEPSRLVDRRIYRIRSRNLLIGAWNAATEGFIGIREKFGDLYLFTEYEYDSDPIHGTARAIDDLGVDVPTDVQMVEHLPARCSEHGALVTWKVNEPNGRVGTWFHEDGTALDRGDTPCAEPNPKLFDLLVQHEATAIRLYQEEGRRVQEEIEAAEAALTSEERAEREQRHLERIESIRAEWEQRRKEREL